MHTSLAPQVREAFNCRGLEWVSNKPPFLPSATQHFTLGFLIGLHDPIKQIGKSYFHFSDEETETYCWAINTALLGSKPLQFCPVPQLLSA